jgi:uncharacterized protein YndB with AHSA1/START domain
MTDPAASHLCRPETEAFLNVAPLRYRVESFIAAPRQKVWDAFADATSWSKWFPFVDRALYEGKTPHGPGTIRNSWVTGVAFEETMLVWDEPHRWGYRIDRTTAPIAKAQVEINEFEEAPGGTRVIWIVATDPLPNLSYLTQGADFLTFMKETFDRAMESLKTHLSSP